MNRPKMRKSNLVSPDDAVPVGSALEAFESHHAVSLACPEAAETSKNGTVRDSNRSMETNEVMTPSPVVIKTSTSLGEAWDLLRTLDVRHLPVVNEDWELVGIVSDRDFGVAPVPPAMAELLGDQRPSLDSPVSTIMTGEPISVDPEEDLDDVIELMLENKIGAVPVVNPEGHVVGIVSYLDVLRKLLGTT